METLFQPGDISHVIQLAVAPVFLLASICAAINVLSQRMGRIIDRGRRLNDMQCEAESGEAIEVDKEQKLLARRAGLINRAMALCILSGLFVCLVIVVLFLDSLLLLRQQTMIAMLFVLALLCLILALTIFLREIDLSLRAFSFGPYKVNSLRT